MTRLNAVQGGKLEFQRFIGTGGIGSGMFFKLDANHTLGRNESRSGVLTTFRDYCKLHIITHYISVLLSASTLTGPQVYPIGKVGDDDTGLALIREMQNSGMSTANISAVSDARTLFSVCFQYPDSTGGNITTSNSASACVTPADIDNFFKTMPPDDKGELILAVPEVPLQTRIRLLEYGRDRKSFNVSAILSSEIIEFKRNGGFQKTDYLAVNIDEARTIAGITDEATEPEVIVRSCIDVLTQINPWIMVTVTDGPNGSYGWVNGCLERIPPLAANAVGTGGAGDAFVSGVITGLCCGLPFLKGANDTFFSETPLKCAIELGTLLASFSVTSPHTIHPEANAEMLVRYAKANDVQISKEFLSMFE